MNKPFLFFLTLSGILLLQLTPVQAQDSLKFPTPAGNPNQLFFLQRNQNTNTVVYELNIKNGGLDTIQPVHVFWICYAEHGQKEELTGIQKKYAYGIIIKYLSHDHYALELVANEKYSAELMRGPDKKFHVYGKINQKQAIINRIYLRIHGGGLFSPNIEYTVISGTDAETGMEIVEKKKP